MRLLGTLPTEPDARRFCDYLVSRRIAAHAEVTTAGDWQVWVEDDDRLDAAAAELRQYHAAPADPRYDAAREADRLRREQAAAAERRRRNFRDVRTTLFTAPDRTVPVTAALVAISVAVYVLTQASPATELALLFDNYTVHPEKLGTRWAMFDSVLHGQLWRLVTPVFLHGSVFHILFNMLWVLDLGRRIESVKGSLVLIGVALTTAVLSDTAQAAWTAVSPWEPAHYVPFLGMSGVVAGLFGYAWVCGKMRPYERVGVGSQEAGYMIGWLVICSFGVVGPIANAAHWGGLAVGMGLGALPSVWKRR